MGAVSVTIGASLGGRFGANHYAAGSDTPAWSSGDTPYGSGSTTFGGSTANLGTPSGSVSTSVSTSVSISGSAETRGTNVAVLECVKL